MQAKRLNIVLIIIIILLVGVIGNFIKKDYLNNEKIILKAMTETEYENDITSLNQSHNEYLNYIEKSKTKIASALTDMGVTTSNEETLENMANNIKSIARDASSISYNNSNTELLSTNVQGAVDELNGEINELNNSLGDLNTVLNKVSNSGKVYHQNVNGTYADSATVASLNLPTGHVYIVIGYLTNTTSGKQSAISIQGNVYATQQSDRTTIGNWRGNNAVTISPNGGTVSLVNYAMDGGSIAVNGFLTAICIA